MSLNVMNTYQRNTGTPFMATLENGWKAAALFCAGVLLIKYCKFVKDYPSVMLLCFGVFGAVFLQ